MHGRHFIFEDLAFVIDIDLHLIVFAKFVVNSVTDLLPLNAGIFCVVCGLRIQNRS